jgi:uncharacterized protein involved in response to NO
MGERVLRRPIDPLFVLAALWAVATAVLLAVWLAR